MRKKIDDIRATDPTPERKPSSEDLDASTVETGPSDGRPPDLQGKVDDVKIELIGLESTIASKEERLRSIEASLRDSTIKIEKVERRNPLFGGPAVQAVVAEITPEQAALQLQHERSVLDAARAEASAATAEVDSIGWFKKTFSHKAWRRIDDSETAAKNANARAERAEEMVRKLEEAIAIHEETAARLQEELAVEKARLAADGMYAEAATKRAALESKLDGLEYQSGQVLLQRAEDILRASEGFIDPVQLLWLAEARHDAGLDAASSVEAALALKKEKAASAGEFVRVLLKLGNIEAATRIVAKSDAKRLYEKEIAKSLSDAGKPEDALEYARKASDPEEALGALAMHEAEAGRFETARKAISTLRSPKELDDIHDYTKRKALIERLEGLEKGTVAAPRPEGPPTLSKEDIMAEAQRLKAAADKIEGYGALPRKELLALATFELKYGLDAGPTLERAAKLGLENTGHSRSEPPFLVDIAVAEAKAGRYDDALHHLDDLAQILPDEGPRYRDWNRPRIAVIMARAGAKKMKKARRNAMKEIEEE